MDKIKEIISEISDASDDIIKDMGSNTTLRGDLGFDSLQLAQLTVEVEDEYDIDIFEDGNVETVQDILDKIKQ